MSLCLTKQELEELSGHKRPSGQKKWLESYGLIYFTALDGYPRVLRSTIENKQIQKTSAPDFTALPKAR